MAEPCSMKSEIEHMKADIVDIKLTAKEQNKDMLLMRDSHTETRIYIRQIQDSQNIMARETKETIASVAKDAKENQTATLKAIQEIKDAPHNSWKQMSIAWKIGLGSLIMSYVAGTIFGFIRNAQ